MASYAVATGEQGAHAKALVAATVDTVTFADPVGEVEVVNHTGATAIYFTVDGVDPTVAGNATHLVPPVAGAAKRVRTPIRSDTVVKLISSGTPTYSAVRV